MEGSPKPRQLPWLQSMRVCAPANVRLCICLSTIATIAVVWGSLLQIVSAEAYAPRSIVCIPRRSRAHPSPPTRAGPFNAYSSRASDAGSRGIGASQVGEASLRCGIWDVEWACDCNCHCISGPFSRWQHRDRSGHSGFATLVRARRQCLSRPCNARRFASN